MISKYFRDKLAELSAPFDNAKMNKLSDSDAVFWLERNSDDPWLFHGMHSKVDNQPVFIGQGKPNISTDPFIWFDDTECTYIHLRILLSAGTSIPHIFLSHGFHLAQQVMEKGVKSLLALQCEGNNNSSFQPKEYSHKLKKAICSISPSLLPKSKIKRLDEIASIFRFGHYVGKYAVDTGGGMELGLDHTRPVDCYMKIIYDVFKPRLAPRRVSVIDNLAYNDSAFSNSDRHGIGRNEIRKALFFRNPVFFNNWEDLYNKL